MKQFDLEMLCAFLENRDLLLKPQHALATYFIKSPSTINAALKRLKRVYLINDDKTINDYKCKEFFKCDVTMFFPDLNDNCIKIIHDYCCLLV